MQLGDPTTDERDQRSPLDEALDDAEQALTTMISLLEAGNLDPLSNEQTISWWQRFETFRNKLPLVDHGLIAHGEASDLPRKYCSSTMIQFLVRVLQLSHGEAAARVHAAAALGARTSIAGEGLEPLPPQLAALQREGVVSPEKVQIVERAMNKTHPPQLGLASGADRRAAAHRACRHLGASGVEAVRPGCVECCRPERTGTHR